MHAILQRRIIEVDGEVKYSRAYFNSYFKELMDDISIYFCKYGLYEIDTPLKLTANDNLQHTNSFLYFYKRFR